MRRDGPSIAIVNSIVVKNDAISASVVDTYRVLLNRGCNVRVFSYVCEYDDVESVVVSNVNDLIFNEFFASVDLIIWHFGIYYDLFDAILLGNGRAKQVVHFHNITPKAFLPARSGDLIDRSLVQSYLLLSASEVWAVSETNAVSAEALGIQRDRIAIVPLIVEDVPLLEFKDKNRESIEILFVGRFVKSKGVLDLLEAFAGLLRGFAQSQKIYLTLVGNMSFSDPDYVAAVNDRIERSDLIDRVTIRSDVTDATLAELYGRSHILAIPSYHEGFCKPVIEALRAGCIPVGYDAYNVPLAVGGLGRLVEPGDVSALERALSSVCSDILRMGSEQDGWRLSIDRGSVTGTEYSGLVRNHVSNFSAERVGALIMSRVHAILA